MKIRYAIDADLPRALFSGLVRRSPELDVNRVQDVGFGSAPDPEVPAFAASEGRITVSRDKSTMLDYAASRVRQGETMPGLLLVRPKFARRHGQGLGTVIDEPILIAECSAAEEWEGVIQFIPFLSETAPS